MRRIDESSLEELYLSAIRAFPHTERRQHSTNTVVIETLTWTPFVGVKTLFVKGGARNGDKSYSPIILFKGVEYGGGGIPLTASDGLEYSVGRLSMAETDVAVRCDCPDFRWRFNYYDHVDKSLYGNKAKKYESKGGRPANPSALPGMCKHLIKLAEALKESGLLL